MAKNIKLNSKKNTPAADGRIYVKSGFFHRYLCSRASGVVVIILQVLSLVLTSIFALCLGVFGSLSMLAEGFEGMMTSVAGYIEAAVVIWMISSVVYVAGTIVLFLGFSRIACLVHGAAAVMSIVVYYLFRLVNKTANLDTAAGPSMLYMPCISIFLISVAVAMVVNIPLWLDKKAEKDSEIAPSILADDKED